MSVLVDSGSTQSFLNLSLLDKFTGVSTTEPIPVKIADGALLHCTSQIADCDWTSNGCTFRSNFRFLPLGAYDGIIGMDWLTQHSPMEVDWAQKWMSFLYKGEKITLASNCQGVVAYTLLELSTVLAEDSAPVHPAVQKILDEFASVFESPTGLPPRRRCYHHIPLIPVLGQ